MSKKYRDCNNIPFSQYREHLPLKLFYWPRMNCVKSPALLRELHEEWDFCHNCSRKAAPGVYLHLHHIFGGMAGRSDERCNLICLHSTGPDQGCHAEAHGGSLPLGRVLYLKWLHDPTGVDWVRLAVLRGSFLPELIVEEK